MFSLWGWKEGCECVLFRLKFGVQKEEDIDTIFITLYSFFLPFDTECSGWIRAVALYYGAEIKLFGNLIPILLYCLLLGSHSFALLTQAFLQTISLRSLTSLLQKNSEFKKQDGTTNQIIHLTHNIYQNMGISLWTHLLYFYASLKPSAKFFSLV